MKTTRLTALIFLILFALLPLGSRGQMPPFNQCPAVGLDSGCAILLVVSPGGSLRVKNDPSQPPYDGVEDTLIGVQNDSDQTILSLPLHSTTDIFGFDGDGLCNVTPRPAGCPFGVTGYEGPGVSFSGISADKTSGVVNFAGGIPPGGSVYFSLEEAIQTQCPPLQGVPLLHQFGSVWSPDTYDHLYRTKKGLPSAATSAVSPNLMLQLSVFPLMSAQPDGGTNYTITLTNATNNLNGLRAAINQLGAGVTAAVMPRTANGMTKYYLQLSPSTAVNSLQLRQTSGDPASNILTDIGAKGCYLTSAAMMINYFAQQSNLSFRTTPRELNNWLNDQADGYTGGNVVPAAVVRYATSHSISLRFVAGKNMRDDFTLDSYLCGGNPVILNVANKGHFVLATGQTTVNGVDTYLINDPGHNRTTLAGYNFIYDGLRLYKTANTPPSALYVVVHSPVELVVSDPSGNKFGFDPRTGSTYDALPGGSYYTDSIADDVDPSEESTPEVKTFAAQNPAAGSYTVQAIGTDNGPFQVDFFGYDTSGNLEGARTFQGTAAPGAVTTYRVTYSPVVGSALTVCASASVTNVSAAPAQIWPPNKNMIDVRVNYAVSSSCGTAAATITSISSNEPITPRDAVIVNGNLVRLRADRLGAGTGRVYTITITATDDQGNQSSQNVTVTVPHDQR
jgi:hypothetical protein